MTTETPAGRSPSPLPCGLALLAALVPLVAASAASADDGVLLERGVVVDRAGAVVYLMESDGSIAARELPSGNLAWMAPLRGEPLGLHGDRLVALAEPPSGSAEASADAARAELLLLEVATGNLAESIAVELPRGVTVGIDDLPNRRFSAATAVADGRLYVHWSFRSEPLRGARVEALGRSSSRSPGAPGREDLVELGGIVELIPESRAARSVDSPDGAPAPRRWIPDLPAEPAASGEPRRFLSVDGRAVLASERLRGGSEPDRYRWTLSDSRSGSPLGSLNRPVSLAPFLVTAGTLVHVGQPYAQRTASGALAEGRLRLEAIDLASGAHLWTVDLRDTRPRAPHPP